MEDSSTPRPKESRQESPRELSMKNSIIKSKLSLGLAKIEVESSAFDSQRTHKPKFVNNLLLEKTAKKAIDLGSARINKIHQEKKEISKRKANFHFHGEDYFFAENSLFCLNEKNRLRLFLVKLMTHR